MTDKERLAAYSDALSNWSITGYIQFKLREDSFRWVTQELGLKEREIKRLMYEYVAEGGKIDEVRETREEWTEHEFHHDLRITIPDTLMYFETRLYYRPPFVPDEPWIEVVDIREQ